jgi:two-component sensor histidine kinase
MVLEAQQRILLLGSGPSLPEEYRRAIDGLAIGPEQGSSAATALSGLRVISHAIAGDPVWANLRELALRHGLRASWSEPIRSDDGRVLGTFDVYFSETRRPDDLSLRLLEIGANLAGIAIEHQHAQMELRRTSHRERLLRDELDHRVKNNLTALISLIDLGTASHRDVKQFAATVKMRVIAMAAVHRLLSSRRWTGIELRRLLTELVPSEHVAAVHAAGPYVLVPPRQSTALGMVLQELITNSLKYGALSAAGGRVDVSWTASPAREDAGQNVDLLWRESGGPPINPASITTGLGTSLMDGLVRIELRGDVMLSFAPEGASHHFILHLDPIETASRIELGT